MSEVVFKLVKESDGKVALFVDGQRFLSFDINGNFWVGREPVKHSESRIYPNSSKINWKNLLSLLSDYKYLNVF